MRGAGRAEEGEQELEQVEGEGRGKQGGSFFMVPARNGGLGCLGQ